MQQSHTENPELTVSMPAYNTGKFITQAIKSVLDQNGVNLELIVVDDCSDDNTLQIIRSIDDPRLRIFANKKRMGIGYCHNLVLDKSKAPFIVHVDSDDFIMPGALQKMYLKIKDNDNLGQVHGFYFIVNDKGSASRHEFRRRKKNYLKIAKPEIDYKNLLLTSAWIMNHLRTYRKEVLLDLGKFNENLTYGIDYDMALRIINKYKIELIPEMVYLYRKHQSNTTRFDVFKKLRMYLQKNVYYGH